MKEEQNNHKDQLLPSDFIKLSHKNSTLHRSRCLKRIEKLFRISSFNGFVKTWHIDHIGLLT